MCENKEYKMPVNPSKKSNFTIVTSQTLKNEYSEISKKIENKLNRNITNPLKII